MTTLLSEAESSIAVKKEANEGGEDVEEEEDDAEEPPADPPHHDQDNGLADNHHDHDNSPKFHVGQDAYHRHSAGGGGIVKVRLLSHGAGWYVMIISNGTWCNNARPSRLTTLMELTSKELSNQRQQDGQGKRTGTVNVKTQRGPRSQSRPATGAGPGRGSSPPQRPGPHATTSMRGPAGA